MEADPLTLFFIPNRLHTQFRWAFGVCLATRLFFFIFSLCHAFVRILLCDPLNFLTRFSFCPERVPPLCFFFFLFLFLRRAVSRIAARVALRLITKIRWVAAAAVLQWASRADKRVRDGARVRRTHLRTARSALELARRDITACSAQRLLRPEAAVGRAAVRRVTRGAHVRIAERAAVRALAHRLRARTGRAREPAFTAGHVTAARTRFNVPPGTRSGRAATRRCPSFAVERFARSTHGGGANGSAARRASHASCHCREDSDCDERENSELSHNFFFCLEEMDCLMFQ